MSTQRLPHPGGDPGNWGTILNGFLDVSHNPNGTLASNTVGTNQIQNNAVTNSQLDNQTQTTLASVASKYVRPAGGIPAADLTTSAQDNLSAASTAVQSVNSKTGTGITLVASDVGALTQTQADARYPQSGAYVPTATPQASVAKSFGTILVTDPVYGAVGDAIEIADATMSAGSAVCTSTAGFFTSAMVNKKAYVAGAAGGNAPLVTTVASYQSANQVTMATPATATSIVSGGPNINAVIGTDNTAAFNAALTAAAAAASGAGTLSRFQNVPQVVVPAGAYLCSPLTANQTQGMSVRGSGTYTTRLLMCDSGALFQMGTYSATPSSAYAGPASHFLVRDMTIAAPIYSPNNWEGIRIGIGIQDNGSGELFLDNVQMQGFQYGVNGAYGSDFSRFGPNLYFSQCDVGMYLGVGSQQIKLGGVDYFGCLEGLVIEGAPQGSLESCSFENNKTADITFDGKTSGVTRSGVPYNLTGAQYWGSWSMKGCWWETGAGGVTTRNCSQNIWVKSVGNTAGWSGIAVRDSFLVSGGAAQVVAGNAAFFNDAGTQPSNPLIDGLQVYGNFINCVYRYSGPYPTAYPVLREISCQTYALSSTAPAALGKHSSNTRANWRALGTECWLYYWNAKRWVSVRY